MADGRLRRYVSRIGGVIEVDPDDARAVETALRAGFYPEESERPAAPKRRPSRKKESGGE